MNGKTLDGWTKKDDKTWELDEWQIKKEKRDGLWGYRIIPPEYLKADRLADYRWFIAEQCDNDDHFALLSVAKHMVKMARIWIYTSPEYQEVK